MQLTVALFGLAAVALAAPGPALTPKAQMPAHPRRQVGGGLGGSVGSGLAGTLSGNVPASGLPFGCIGGEIGDHGITICARETPAPVAAKRQVGGGLGGSVGSGLAGTLTGIVPASGIPFGCIGGEMGGNGITICARNAKATPAPQIKHRQVGGGLGGSVGSGLQGSLTGIVPASGLPFGCIEGNGVEICARDAKPTPTQQLENRQIGGGLGGSVGSGLGGTLTGFIPPTGAPSGSISGHDGDASASDSA